MLARGTRMRARATLVRAGSLLLLAGLVALAWWVFRATGHDYWRFWLDSGPVIGLATAAFGWAWGGLDRNPGLVSADPLDYAGAALQVAGLPLIAFGGHMSPASHHRPVSFPDMALTLLMGAIFGVAVIAWLVLIAPAQYFAFLLAGAPSRVALGSRYRVYARLEGQALRYTEGRTLEPADYENQGWWDASMRDRPVTVASAFMAAALLVIDMLA